MAGNLQPLDQKFPIVTADGRPTLYFIQWAQQKQIDISAGITAEQALAIIEQYLADHQLQAGTGISISPSGNLSDAPTIAAEVQAILDQITTTQGSILFRGAADWQALAPGAAGQFLKTNGAGADPAWAAGGGGGGGLILGNIFPQFTGTSGTGQASKGVRFTPTDDFTLYGIRTHMVAIAGTPYIGKVWTLSGSNLATEIATTASWNGLASAEEWRTNMLVSPVALTAGTQYVILITATAQANTYGFTMYGDTSASSYIGVPAASVNYARIASNAPASGNTISFGGGNYHVDMIAEVSF